MKISKSNPKHVLVLTLSIFTSIYVVFLRFAVKKNPNFPTIIFYGHTLNGNLAAFFDYLKRKGGYKVYFLSLDKEYRNRLENKGFQKECILSGINYFEMTTVSRADAIITSHGLHFFSILRALTDIKFIDVWHGIPFKGFDKESFKHLHKHDEIFVSSNKMKDIYHKKFGFSLKQLKVTGYSRVDQLINGTLSKEKLLKTYGLPLDRRYILLAPTWKQDDSGRSIVPFGVKEGTFFNELNSLAGKHDAIVIFRSHINSDHDTSKEYSNIAFMPYKDYEIAEHFLFISDILITDWSSIAFDYLPLKKPTIFLDVEAPFKKGYTLGPEYRYGEIVKDLDSLKVSIKKFLVNPEIFTKSYGESMDKISNFVYGDTLDGKSSQRYERSMHELITKN